MFLYFNGDSFVSGCELGDHILTGYPGLLPWPIDTAQHEAHNKWLLKSHAPPVKWEIAERSHKLDEISRLEFERSFPNKAASMTGLRFTNSAIHGASMDRIVRTSIIELCELKKLNPNEEIIAFVGTTYPGRWEVAYDKIGDSETNGNPKDWICLSNTYKIDAESDYLKDMRKLKTIHYSHYHTMVNFYKNIILLQDFCLLNNIKLYWIASFDNVLKRPLPLEEYNDREDLNTLIEYANLTYAVDMLEIIETQFNGQNIVCPGGHFGEPVHEIVAQQIVKILYG